MSNEFAHSGMEEIASWLEEANRRLPIDDPGATYKDMEARLAKIDSGIEHLDRDVGELKADVRDIRNRVSASEVKLGSLEVKVDHLPTKAWVDARIVFLVVAVGLLVAFQGNIQTLLGIAPQ